MNDSLYFDHPSCPAQQTIMVSQEIAILELLPAAKGAHAGRITPVPKGAHLEICGKGFTERTIQVRWGGHLGFAFLQDVEPLLSVHQIGQAQALSAPDLVTT
jgi:hypothetical protein